MTSAHHRKKCFLFGILIVHFAMVGCYVGKDKKMDGEEIVECELGTGALAPSWSPDGQKLIYSSNPVGNYEIFEIILENGHARQLTSNPKRNNYFPYYSPDGNRVVFMSIDTSGVTATVDIMDVNGNNLIHLTDTSGYSGDPHWSPDGRQIAFHSRQNGNEDIFVRNIENDSLLTQLTFDETNDINPIWSPDGSKITFVTHRDGKSEIYIMEPDGSNQQNITRDSIYDYFPFWSPDGKQIIFSGRIGLKDPTGIEIYTITIDGENRKQLTFNKTYDSSPHWSPDGKKIAFCSCRSGRYQIHIMNDDGSNVIQVTH